MLLAAILVGSGCALVIGWRLFWFICDDAYISFRYISNSMLGYGHVWNPPPFRPVEGYTNFLWMLLLEFMWRVFRVEPPQSANYASLVFALLTMWLVSLSCLRLNWSERLREHRLYFIGLAMAALVTNRTVLAWSSSGLETAFFNFFLLSWVYCALFRPIDTKYWGFSLMALASTVYLIRPDGILFLVATLLMLLIVYLKRESKRLGRTLISVAPLLVPILHLAWRRHTYGEWLPNTYFAKTVAIWPQSGIRYLLSFVLEYALWIWLALAVWVLVRRVSRTRRGSERSAAGGGAGIRTEGVPGRARTSASRHILHVVIGAVLVHLMYYTFIVGGDHFEYRVYSHLPYLIVISFIWMVNELRLRRAVASILLVSFIACSLPVPWSHWAYTHNLTTRQETNRLHIRLADHWPKPVSLYAAAFDDLQYWLIEHYVCLRHQEHKANFEYLEARFPSREFGSTVSSDGYPVFAFPAVGLASWVLPHINVIDLHGLNDYVIARHRPPETQMRLMAHERRAPRGYVQCFAPNVEVRSSSDVVILERSTELTAEDIVAAELNWAEIVKKR